MKILTASAFSPESNTGAAGTLLSIGKEWERSGNTVNWTWTTDRSRYAIVNQLSYIPAALLRDVRGRLQSDPDTDVVIISQPYAFRTIEVLRPLYPKTLFVNRTHGWEPRFTESQDRYGWSPHVGIRHRLLRMVARKVRGRQCQRAVDAAHGLVAACREDADWIRSKYRLPDWCVKSIPYGIDAEALPPVPEVRTACTPRRLVFAGQYDRRKGSTVLESVLPRIATSHPNVTLTFVVPAETIPLIEGCYRSAWGNRLKVVSWVPRSQLYDIFGTHDVLLFPTFFEGFGKVLLEALAMGCVVIGFAEGAASDLESEACLTCPKGDVETFGRLVRSTLDREVDWTFLTKEAVRAGRQRTWADTAVETLNYFRELIDQHGLTGRTRVAQDEH